MKLSASLSVDSSSLSFSSTVLSSLSVDLLACDKHVSLSRWLSWWKSNRKDGSIEVERALKKITATGKHVKICLSLCFLPTSSKASGADSGDDDESTNRPLGVKQAKARCKKTLADGKNLSKFQSMWSKQQDLALKERISKMKLLDSLIAKEGPLEDYEEALKKKLINELMNN
ncbi:hypothetical protein F2Q69_00061728 [Brassica cretica]|uniref:No apical meristem-associated C-terminal domain-containing protein n=1 Tax=Brassica cretica TaxID=69181 RepID=A0A8S9RJQ3_BRACR|nr:hypothetical protein F2Q69_00061728 [Brassica cretica]